MSSSDQQPNPNSNDDQSMKLAIAISLLRSKLLQQPSAAATADTEALKWKRKAKERKEQIHKLREHLKEAEDPEEFDMLPQVASCKCYFFDSLGRSNPRPITDGSHRRFDDVLRRRFLKQVRFKERRRKSGVPSQRWRLLEDLNYEDERKQLRASVDFLVDLCDTISSVDEGNFKNWSHQAVDFILASMKTLLSKGEKEEHIEDIISSLIMRLVKRMCTPLRKYESHQTDAGPPFYIQHIIRKLGIEPYIGNHAILSISRKISAFAENLLFLDPFDDAFPSLHESMFILIQLIEFLVSDYLATWLSSNDFNDVSFEEWVRSILQARKDLEGLENRSGLYVHYMDRVVGELAKLVSQSSMLQKLSPDIRDNLLQ